MTIQTYAELKQGIIDWSKRSDTLSLLDTFIDLAESEMYGNTAQPLRIRDMETSATGSTSTTLRTLALPTRFLEFRRVKINQASGDLKLEYATPEAIPIRPHAGMPKWFTVTSTLEFDCVADQAYTVEMQYFQSLVPLSASAPANAILTRFPTIYLWGSLAALFQWAKQLDQADYYYQQFLGAISKANQQDNRGRYGPGPTVKMVGITP